MELHRSCILPSNAPALPTPDSDIPREVLQERSANRAQRHDDSSWPCSPTSPAGHPYPRVSGGSYMHLPGQKSDEQVEYEFRKLQALLQQCPKYRKYREKPATATNAKEEKWPIHLENAFWRALIRWPPMGKGKLMINGVLHGRNELISDSIGKETGLNLGKNGRKKVSSHIQVLRLKVEDQPLLLRLMPKPENKKKGRRNNNAHAGHMRSRHHARPASAFNATVEKETPFAVKHFAMLVQDRNKLPIHYVTQMGEHARLPDLHFSDISTWHKQYPELSFHDTEDWKHREVFVCHASIDLMERQPLGAELTIPYDIDVRRNLARYEPIQCRTQFYDSGKLVHDETKDCEYASSTTRKLHFGSHFWVRRLSQLHVDMARARRKEDPDEKKKLESNVQRSLQYLTAIQEIYGAENETGEQQCLLTVLWRFQKTRSSNERGKVTWRIVNFPQQRVQRPWNLQREVKPILDNTAASAQASMYTSLAMDIPQQSFVPHLPPLDLDTLSNIPMDPMGDFSVPHSATALSMVTDYSQQSLPSLSHSQDTRVGHSQGYPGPNEIDFNGGHIAMHLEPAINFGAYEDYACESQSSILHPSLHGLSSTQEAGNYGDLGLSTAMTNCYPSKPWEHYDLISRMEAGAEQMHGMLGQTTNNCGDAEVVGHGVLHDGQLGHGLWKLQSPFPEDTIVGPGGAVAGAEDTGARKEHVQGILEMIERDQRDAGRF